MDFAAVFAWQPTAYLVLSPQLVIVEANQAYLELLGRTREELIGRPVFDAFPPAPHAVDEHGDNPLQLSFQRARDRRVADQMPLFHYDVLDQATGRMLHRVWSLISAPVLDEHGNTQLILQRVEDVSDCVAARANGIGQHSGTSAGLEMVEADLYARAQELRAALAAERTATLRLTGLAQVALQLAAAQTVTELAETVAGAGLAAVGADGGPVGVRDDERGVVAVTVTSSLGEHVQQQYAQLPADSRLPAAWAAATGEMLLLGDRATGLAWSAAMTEVYESTGRLAWLAVPLRVGDRLLGSLTAGWAHERMFTPDEVDLVQAFAAQCAQTLDRLQVQVAGQRIAEANGQLSETWQRSLLTEPPQLENLHVEVRYQPAAAHTEVGGDWYDAFLTENGDLTLVIGDVTGHDRTAAPAVAQICNVLRGVAQAVSEPPARVLATLDKALHHESTGVGAVPIATRVEAGLRGALLPHAQRADDGTVVGDVPVEVLVSRR